MVSGQVAGYTTFFWAEIVCLCMRVCVCVAKSSSEEHLTSWDGDQDPQCPANTSVSQPGPQACSPDHFSTDHTNSTKY